MILRFNNDFYKTSSTPEHDIPEKANRVLNIILIAIFIILIRLWHLSVIQYDHKLEESRKPQRRLIIEPAKRATIRDRYNIPLAINRIQYQATILYSQIKQIPSNKWISDEKGKRIKISKRKEYIAELSRLLAQELQLDEERLEDLIHSKASFYASIPFVIKEDLSEKEYYRLKMLEKDWLGIHVRKIPRRYYPQGRVGADIVGYMGSINKKEYESIIHEIKGLEEYILANDNEIDPELPKGIEDISQAVKRLKDLQDRAYTINDYVGKTGIEGIYEEELRGFHGKKIYYSDARGNFLKELPGSRKPLSGDRFLLTISTELQEYAEHLLIQNETIRPVLVTKQSANKQTTLATKHPWIKGGSIVVMDPNNGEMLALATYPRFDPNDFIMAGNSDLIIKKKNNVNRWFENDHYLGMIWNQMRPLEREVFNKNLQNVSDDGPLLSWDQYLQIILPANHSVTQTLKTFGTISDAINLQNDIEKLMNLSPSHNIYLILNQIYSNGHIAYKQEILPSEIIELNFKKNTEDVLLLQKRLDPYLKSLPHQYDKALLIDLYRLALNKEGFSDNLLKKVGHQTLDFYRDVSCAMVSIKEVIKGMSKELFHEIYFKEWRIINEKDF